MFKIFQENKTISWILSQKKYINFSPAYQRRGNVWGREQKQLLIDSIINSFQIIQNNVILPDFFFCVFFPSVTRISSQYITASSDSDGLTLGRPTGFFSSLICIISLFADVNKIDDIYTISIVVCKIPKEREFKGLRHLY